MAEIRIGSAFPAITTIYASVSLFFSLIFFGVVYVFRMGLQNKNESRNNNRKVVAEEKKDNGGGDKKNEDSNSFKSVYKIDMHCEGCATKIKRCVKDFRGVEDVKAEMVLNKPTVVGKVDPSMLRDKLSQKRKRDVELISPLPPKKYNKAAADDNKPDKKPKNKKLKEAPVKTSVLKLALHCSGCIGKINRLVCRTKGTQEMTLDKEKELVIVKGTMDVKALAEGLRNKLRRPVEIVPPEKEKEKDGGGSRGDGDKKDGNGGGSGGGKKKGGGGDGGQEEGGGGGGGKNRMDGFGHPGFGYYDHSYGYGNGFVNGYGHANGSEWEWTCAWILRTLYPWVDPWVGTCNMHQICSVKKTQMLALPCEEGKMVF